MLHECHWNVGMVHLGVPLVWYAPTYDTFYASWLGVIHSSHIDDWIRDTSAPWMPLKCEASMFARTYSNESNHVRRWLPSSIRLDEVSCILVPTPICRLEGQKQRSTLGMVQCYECIWSLHPHRRQHCQLLQYGCAVRGGEGRRLWCRIYAT